MQPDWVRSIQKQCERDRVPFFFKQWGGTRKKVAGRVLDGKTHNDFPELGLANSVNQSVRAILPDLRAAFVPVEALASR
jgi:hypothetical protein